MKVCISVIGAGDASPEEAKIAEEVGMEIARNNAVLVCGGLGGVMNYAAKGAKEMGGLTVGILPGDNSDNVNPYIDIPILTGMGHARNVIVAYSGDVVIAVGGKTGTLSEIAFALIQDKPVIGIKSWILDKNRIYGKGMIVAENAKDAVNKAIEIIKNR